MASLPGEAEIVAGDKKTTQNAGISNLIISCFILMYV